MKPKKLITSEIIKTLSSFFLLFILTSVDFLSLGHTFFSGSNLDTNEDEYKSISRIIFLSSTFLAHLSMNIFTKISSGVAAGSIIENISNFKILKDKIKKFYDENSEINSKISEIDFFKQNIMFLMIISCLLFALLSFIVYKFDLSRFLEKLPTAIIIAIMTFIGFNQFKIFLEGIQISGNTQNLSTIKFFNFRVISSQFYMSITSILFLFACSKIFPDFYLLIPLYVLLSCIIFYLGLFIKFKLNPNLVKKFLVEKDILFSVDKFQIESYYNLVKKITLKIKLKLLIDCSLTIINILFISIIQMPINFLSFSRTIKVKNPSNLRREHLTQTLTNLICCLGFSPSYMIGCHSIFFNKSGAQTRLISFIGGFGILVVAFTSKFFAKFIPKFVMASIPLFLCFSFCEQLVVELYSSIFNRNKKQNGKIEDFISIFVTLTLLFYTGNYIVTIAVVLFLNYIQLKIYTIFAKKKNLKVLSFLNFEDITDIKKYNEKEYYYLDWYVRTKIY